MLKKCSECGKAAVRETCGAPVCQVSRKRKRDSVWWRKNGKVANGKRR
jgi:hypothetical protein